jgi:hypothetical protein
MFHLLRRYPLDVTLLVHPAHHCALLDPDVAAELTRLGGHEHAVMVPPRWCDPSIAPTGWQVAGDTVQVAATVTHWCSAVPARRWWADAPAFERQRLSTHAMNGDLDPRLSPRTSVNVILETAEGHLVGMRRSETVTNPGAFDIPSEVLDHNDLVTTAHGWTASMLAVARRTVSEEAGITDLAGARLTAWAWQEDIATALAFAHLVTPMTFAQVRSAWAGCEGRDESAEVFPLPDGPVNTKVDFARSVL